MNDTSTATVQLQWAGGHAFTASDPNGYTITVCALSRTATLSTAFRPGDLLLTSLAACSGIDIVGILRKQRQEVTDIDISR